MSKIDLTPAQVAFILVVLNASPQLEKFTLGDAAIAIDIFNILKPYAPKEKIQGKAN